MSVSFGEGVYNSTIRHQVHLERFKTATVRRLISLLNETETDIRTQVLSLDESWTRRRLEKLLREIQTINERAFKTLLKRTAEELGEFSVYEAEFTTAQFNKALPATLQAAIEFIAPADPLLFVAADQPQLETLVKGRPIRDWFSDLADRDTARMHQAIRTGFLEGESTAKIVKRVIGTRPLRFKDGVREVTRRETEALVHTSVQAASTAAREQVYGANTPLIKKVRYVATLDGRTTMICRSLDQEEFEVGEGPRPPLHMRCRSTTVPITRSWRELGFDSSDSPRGMRPFIRDKRKLKDIPKADRDALVGRVNSDLSYSKWLKRQPQDFIESVMGKTKAKLFLDGGLPMDRFRDLGAVREYTLDELRRLEPAAFRKAGIDA